MVLNILHTLTEFKSSQRGHITNSNFAPSTKIFKSSNYCIINIVAALVNLQKVNMWHETSKKCILKASVFDKFHSACATSFYSAIMR